MKLIEKSVCESVRKLVEYMHDDEERSFQEGQDDKDIGTMKGDSSHIYHDVVAVQAWLEAESGQSNPHVKITPFDSPRSDRPVANQWVITTDEGEFFQSYRSIIAFKPYGGGKVVLDEGAWDYSTTTGRYRNEFLGEGIAETRAKIASGEYAMANLNQK